MNTAELIGRYVAYRDLLASETEAFEARFKPYKDAMEVIAGVVQLELINSSEESVRTEAGTAYLSTTMHARVKDRDALFDFVREADALELLTAAVSKDQVKTWMDEHQGAVPPGVEVTHVTKCNFRRA